MEANTAYSDSGAVVKQLLKERTLTYGALPGKNIYDWAAAVVIVAPGAPGTNNKDLQTLVTPDGSTLLGSVGKLVYLEVVQLSGEDDLAIRKAAATPIDLLSGTTDTFSVKGGHAVLLDLLTPGTSNLVEGLAFDATHKNLQFESTVGCSVAVLAVVI